MLCDGVYDFSCFPWYKRYGLKDSRQLMILEWYYFGILLNKWVVWFYDVWFVAFRMLFGTAYTQHVFVIEAYMCGVRLVMLTADNAFHNLDIGLI